jgi:uncharacterized membrane protein
MEKLKAVWKDVIESLWFVPAVLTTTAGALAVLLVYYDEEIKGGLDPDDVWWLFGGGSDGAKSVLEAIAGSIMTVTGVVFSVTIIALQLASNQYTPRVLRQFMADRANQIVLGVFIGTFTYTILVLRTIRSSGANEEAFIPSVAVTGSLLLTLVSLGFLIFFINHLAHSIQATQIVDSVVKTSLTILRTVYPDELHEWTVPSNQSAQELTPGEAVDPFDVRATSAGYVQAVERRALRRFAGDHDVVVRVEVHIGSYVIPGQTILKVWSDTPLTIEMEQKLTSGLVLGLERTPHQDMMHGFVEMMDIAVKALSPSINDPTTAVNVIQRQAQVLLDMAWRECGPVVDRDGQDRVRFIMPRPSLADATGMAFNQIRHYGASNPTVAIALLDTLAELAALAPDSAKAPFTDQLHAVITSTRELMKNPADRDRVETAIARALERSQDPAPRQRPHR